MLIFEIYKNSKLQTRSGKSDLCVMSANITAVGVLGSESSGAVAKRKGIKLSFDVGGVVSDASSQALASLNWHHSILEVGDEITIKICDSDQADEAILPSKEQIYRIKKSQEKAEHLAFERARKTYFELKEKYDDF